MPVAGASPVSEQLVAVDGEFLVGAAEGRGQENGSILDQTLVDSAAGAGEGVEGIEVNRRNDGDNDTGACKSLGSREARPGHGGIRITAECVGDGIRDGRRRFDDGWLDAEPGGAIDKLPEFPLYSILYRTPSIVALLVQIDKPGHFC